jgi:glycerol-3-phosphate acyltransferase PlsX
VIRIALDAMGGDLGSSVVVEGAVSALRGTDGIKVLLTGDEAQLKAEIVRLGGEGLPIEVVPTTQVIEMHDHPVAALKHKPDSSLLKCVMLQKQGLADASVSPGNSGAMMAASLTVLGRAGKVSRPAVAPVLPSLGGPFVLVDAGANKDEKAAQLLQFGQCGAILAKHTLKVENPRVALLNMGEEDEKGTETVAETFQLLKKSGLNFVGNVEGHDLIKGGFDVLVTGGFTGNIVLKLYEGFGAYMRKAFAPSMPAEQRAAFDKAWSYEANSAAPLLGLNGAAFIMHGRSTAEAFRQAIHIAAGIAGAEVHKRIAAEVESLEA